MTQHADDIADALTDVEVQRGNSDDFDVRALEVRAVRARAAKMTYDEIADLCGYSDRGQARKVVLRALDRVQAESVAELRRESNLGLDEAQRAIWPKVLNGIPRAIDTYLRIEQRRAALNGTDAPKQLVVSSGAVAQVEDALAAIEELVLGEDGVYAVEPDAGGESSSPPGDTDPTS